MAQRAFSDFIGFSRPSAAWRFNSSFVLVQEAAHVWRDDYDPVTMAWRGFLIEEQRTNSIRNNSMTGAVAGSPGTWPTYWGINTAASLSNSIVGTGVEDGIPYMDVRIFGTTDSTTGRNLAFETSTGVPAVSGQTWTMSVFLRLIAGSFAGVTAGLSLSERDSSGGFIQSATSSIAPTSAPLKTQRFALTKTFSSPSAAYALPLFFINYAVGVAVDFTLRIGIPQLELGTFATSSILTTNAQVTRAADLCWLPTGSWFQPGAGMLYVEFEGLKSQARYAAGLTDTTVNNLIGISVQGAANLISRVTTAGNVIENILKPGYASERVKVAVAWDGTTHASCVNGGAVVSVASAAPAGITTLGIGGYPLASAIGGLANGWIRVVGYGPRRPANADLQTLTA